MHRIEITKYHHKKSTLKSLMSGRQKAGPGKAGRLLTSSKSSRPDTDVGVTSLVVGDPEYGEVL